MISNKNFTFSAAKCHLHTASVNLASRKTAPPPLLDTEYFDG
jgi:hypothetical protein